MSKKKARQRQKPKSRQQRGRSHQKAILIIGLILCLGVTGVILAQLKATRTVTKTNAMLTAPMPTQTPQLSKEYIYAGGKLIAIEEPSTTGGSGPAPTNLVATATSDTVVSLTWTAPAGSVISYQVERSQSVNGSYTTLSPNPTTTSFTDTTASSGVAYLYRVRAAYTGGGHSDYSNKDLATTIVFFEDPLNSGGTRTVIRARHLTELRQAVDAVRTLAGLTLASWTYPDPVSDIPEQRRKIYLEDLTDLRARLDEALTPLGRLQAYDADPPLSRGSPISAAHFTQIRDRVK